MKEFWQKVLASLVTFKAQLNTALNGLPANEQYEANSELGWAVKDLARTIKNGLEQAEEFEKFVNETLSKADEVVATAAEEKAKELAKTLVDAELTVEKLSQNDVVKGLIQAAEKAAAEGVRQQVATLAERRKELLSTYPADVVAIFSDELLSAEDYLERAKIANERLSQLDEIGVEVPAVRASLALLPVDADGKTKFTEQLSVYQEVAGKGRSLGGLGGGKGDRKDIVLI